MGIAKDDTLLNEWRGKNVYYDPTNNIPDKFNYVNKYGYTRAYGVKPSMG